ncbi:MAG: PadR family transcriptional regulator [Thermoprotei archaeon]|jgi:DNA-binding PadR family transcriptional regulator
MWHYIEFRRRIGKEGGLRFLVLWILSEAPKNGVEIINEIERMTWGWWRPSPGSIYPLLSTLLRDGLVTKLENGRYKLTEKGLEEIKEVLPFRKPRSIEDMLTEIESYVSYLEDTGKSKLAPYKSRIEDLKNRLERLITP